MKDPEGSDPSDSDDDGEVTHPSSRAMPVKVVLLCTLVQAQVFHISDALQF